MIGDAIAEAEQLGQIAADEQHSRAACRASSETSASSSE